MNLPPILYIAIGFVVLVAICVLLQPVLGKRRSSGGDDFSDPWSDSSGNDFGSSGDSGDSGD